MHLAGAGQVPIGTAGRSRNRVDDSCLKVDVSIVEQTRKEFERNSSGPFCFLPGNGPNIIRATRRPIQHVHLLSLSFNELLPTSHTRCKKPKMFSLIGRQTTNKYGGKKQKCTDVLFIGFHHPIQQKQKVLCGFVRQQRRQMITNITSWPMLPGREEPSSPSPFKSASIEYDNFFNHGTTTASPAKSSSGKFNKDGGQGGGKLENEVLKSKVANPSWARC